LSYDRYIPGIFQVYTVCGHMSGIYQVYTMIINFLRFPDAINFLSTLSNSIKIVLDYLGIPS
jgi:hypothetical protein